MGKLWCMPIKVRNKLNCAATLHQLNIVHEEPSSDSIQPSMPSNTSLIAVHTAASSRVHCLGTLAARVSPFFKYSMAEYVDDESDLDVSLSEEEDSPRASPSPVQVRGVCCQDCCISLMWPLLIPLLARKSTRVFVKLQDGNDGLKRDSSST